MRIVNRKEFLQISAGTVYCKYFKTGSLGDLCVKHGSLSNDWNYQQIPEFDEPNSSEELFELLDKMENDPTVTSTYSGDVSARDGLFEDEQLFLVFSRNDVSNMIVVLLQTLK